MPEQLAFRNRALFRDWLRKNHDRTEGLWLIFGKNHALETLTPDEALEEAICFGWIDGLIKRVDEGRYLKFFSPRRAKSKWSERNKKLAMSLILRKRMVSPGLKAVQSAKQNGAWDSPAKPLFTHEDVARFAELISISPKAAENFQKMPESAKRQFAGFYLDAKHDSTRLRRLEKVIRLLEQNKRPML